MSGADTDSHWFLPTQVLPPACAQMLRGWVHSGFHVHRSRRVAPEERADLERLAQYIIRNPFAVEKMQVTEANRANPDGSIIYRSGMNPKIQRNFEVFTPCEFIAAITQHIPDKNFQLVRYYGWYSNKMRGQRGKQAAAAVQPDGKAAAVIDVPEHKPRRIPSKKWRELIKKVWLFGGGIDVSAGFCRASPMTSLLQTGFGMFSARVGRYRPGDAEKRFLSHSFLCLIAVNPIFLNRIEHCNNVLHGRFFQYGVMTGTGNITTTRHHDIKDFHGLHAYNRWRAVDQHMMRINGSIEKHLSAKLLLKIPEIHTRA
jgi:hypothetical protein